MTNLLWKGAHKRQRDTVYLPKSTICLGIFLIPRSGCSFGFFWGLVFLSGFFPRGDIDDDNGIYFQFVYYLLQFIFHIEHSSLIQTNWRICVAT